MKSTVLIITIIGIFVFLGRIFIGQEKVPVEFQLKTPKDNVIDYQTKDGTTVYFYKGEPIEPLGNEIVEQRTQNARYFKTNEPNKVSVTYSIGQPYYKDTNNWRYLKRATTTAEAFYQQTKLVWWEKLLGKRALADTIDKTVEIGEDDGFRYTGTYGFSNSSQHAAIGYRDAAAGYKNCNIFLRFTDITISGTIDVSYISLYRYQTATGNPETKIYVVNEDNPAAPVSVVEFDAALLTTASVDWDYAIPAINQYYNSPSLNTVFQELVNSYTISNDAVIVQVKDDIGTGNNFNIIRLWDYDGIGTYAPKLHIEYTIGSLDTISPVISNTSVSNKTAFSTQVRWATDERSTSRVEYGLTNSYGSLTILDDTIVTSHSVTLADLLPDTLYHYRVKSKDPSGNEAVSSDQIFSTSPPPVSILSPLSGWEGWSNIDTIYYNPSQDDTANKFLDTASQELKTYLDKMSGRSWNIVQNDPGGSAVRLQVNQSAPEFTNRGDEAVQLVTDATGVRIIGKTPIAVRHGAYILLEKLGVRWFFKHSAWEVVPVSLVDTVAFNEVHEPFYFWRFIAPITYVGRRETANWNMRNRLYGTMNYLIFHNYSQIIDRPEYDTHPEWFLPEGRYPNYPWQLRPDNPDVIARAVQYVRTQLSQPPTKPSIWNDLLPLGSVSISPNDGRGWDPPWGTDWQLITDKVFGLANEVAKVIKKEFPNKYIGVYSYTLYAGTPTIALEPNLIALITTDYNNTPLTLEEQIRGMLSKGVVVGIYDYLDIWVWWQDSPTINLDRIRNLASYASQGVRYYDGESGDSWAGRGGLTYYLVSKMLWNPRANIDALLDDFYTQAFGTAKQVMKHYYEVRNIDTASLTASFYDLQQAESLAAGNEETLERIRQLEYYNRYLWLWKNKGITNLNLDELKSFYTFISKIRDLYVVFDNYVEDNLRTELKNRGLTDVEINALQDFTPPTATEATNWLNEALTAFGIPPIQSSFTISNTNRLYLFQDKVNTLQITGTNFDLNTTFGIKFLQGATVVSQHTLTPIDSSTIYLSLTHEQLNDLPIGLYDLKIERTTDNIFQTFSKQILITTLGDLWSSTATETAEQKRDGKVNLFDVSRLLSKWGSTQADDLAEADINAGPSNISQGKIDLFDANLLMKNWRL